MLCFVSQAAAPRKRSAKKGKAESEEEEEDDVQEDLKEDEFEEEESPVRRSGKGGKKKGIPIAHKVCKEEQMM
jgi:hypothetical protein